MEFIKRHEVFLYILFLALVMRLALALMYDGFLGVDGGAYLLSRNAVLGDEPTGAGFPRPPLAPGWLMVPFTSLWGDDVGYKIWSAVFSITPLIAIYFIGLQLTTRVAAVIAALFFSVDLLQAEMFVTGALPLIAFSFLGLAWLAMIKLSEDMTRQHWYWMALLTVSVAIIPFINQTTAGLAVVSLPVLWLALFWFRRRGSDNRWLDSSNVFWQVTPALLLGGLLALTALPWYLKVLPGNGLLHYDGPLMYLTSAGDTAWWQFFVAMPVAIWFIAKSKVWQYKALASVLALHTFLLIFLSYDETIINVFYRSRYLIAIPFYLLIAVLIQSAINRAPSILLKRLFVTFAFLSFAVMLVGYQWQFHGQAKYSAMITPPAQEALALAQEIDSEAAIINNAFTMSLWIAALNKVEAPHIWTAKPPATWVETDKKVRCVLNWVEGCDPLAAAHDLKAKFVLIEHRFPNLNKRVPGNYGAPPAQWEKTAAAPWLRLLYEKDTVKLWAINPIAREYKDTVNLKKGDYAAKASSNQDREIQ